MLSLITTSEVVFAYFFNVLIVGVNPIRDVDKVIWVRQFVLISIKLPASKSNFFRIS